MGCTNTKAAKNEARKPIALTQNTQQTNSQPVTFQDDQYKQFQPSQASKQYNIERQQVAQTRFQQDEAALETAETPDPININIATSTPMDQKTPQLDEELNQQNQVKEVNNEGQKEEKQRKEWDPSVDIKPQDEASDLEPIMQFIEPFMSEKLEDILITTKDTDVEQFFAAIKELDSDDLKRKNSHFMTIVDILTLLNKQQILANYRAAYDENDGFPGDPSCENLNQMMYDLLGVSYPASLLYTKDRQQVFLDLLQQLSNSQEIFLQLVNHVQHDGQTLTCSVLAQKCSLDVFNQYLQTVQKHIPDFKLNIPQVERFLRSEKIGDEIVKSDFVQSHLKLFDSALLSNTKILNLCLEKRYNKLVEFILTEAKDIEEFYKNAKISTSYVPLNQNISDKLKYPLNDKQTDPVGISYSHGSKDERQGYMWNSVKNIKRVKKGQIKPFAFQTISQESLDQEANPLQVCLNRNNEIFTHVLEHMKWLENFHEQSYLYIQAGKLINFNAMELLLTKCTDDLTNHDKVRHSAVQGLHYLWQGVKTDEDKERYAKLVGDFASANDDILNAYEAEIKADQSDSESRLMSDLIDKQTGQVIHVDTYKIIFYELLKSGNFCLLKKLKFNSYFEKMQLEKDNGPHHFEQEQLDVIRDRIQKRDSGFFAELLELCPNYIIYLCEALEEEDEDDGDENVKKQSNKEPRTYPNMQTIIDDAIGHGGSRNSVQQVLKGYEFLRDSLKLNILE